MFDETFDYIVVGAGSAGCVLAARLSEDARNRVLLLEAGGSDRRLRVRLPIGYGLAFHDRRINWCYETEPDPGLAGRRAYWPRGKVLGGSSSINAMVWCRGLASDYDDWRDAGNPGWSWSDVAPVFRRFERTVRLGGAVDGDGAQWVCDRAAEYHPLKRHFLAAAAELGWPVVDFNGPDPVGVGAYALTTRGGLRCSAADAFLRPAMARRNLTVRTRILVERIVFAGRRAVGVRCRAGRQVRSFGCRGEVILAAGAVNTPKLLQLSGIGPAALLAAFGIGVLHANDAVGGGLQDHLGINYVYRATEPTLNAVLGTWAGRARAAWRYMVGRDGPLSLGVNQMGGLVRSRADAPRADIQLYFNPLSYTTQTKGKRRLLRPDRFPGFCIGFNACRPTSVGRVDIRSPDPGEPPRIAPGYLSTNHDVIEALAGARLVGRLQQTAAMQRLIDGPPAFDPAGASDAAVLQDLRSRSASVFHACGTCRMAPEERRGVVGHDLRVHGVEGLRVADSSVFPNITAANTNAPTILVAHKAAAAILGHG